MLNQMLPWLMDLLPVRPTFKTEMAWKDTEGYLVLASCILRNVASFTPLFHLKIIYQTHFNLNKEIYNRSDRDNKRQIFWLQLDIVNNHITYTILTNILSEIKIALETSLLQWSIKQSTNAYSFVFSSIYHLGSLWEIKYVLYFLSPL